MINCTTESNNRRGTSILLRNKLDIEIINENNSDDGRIVLLNFKYNQYIYTICCIYLPNKIKDKLLFFLKAEEWNNIILNIDHNIQILDENTK